MGKEQLSITYLFFTDDSILFGEAIMEGAITMKTIVNEYKSISSQLVNFENSLIYFSKNVQDDLKEQIGGVLRVRISNNLEKYLGLPTMVGKKKGMFVELKEKVIQKNVTPQTFNFAYYEYMK